MSKRKLLILAVGTEASGAAREAKAQIQAHPDSELEVMVRYIDTAWLPSHDDTLRSTEWFHLQINPDYIHDLLPKIKEHPRIQKLLFGGLLPATHASGGGAIRYNGAGAIEVQRNDLRDWLSKSMTELKSTGNGQTFISIALIISSVGATGSGSLERLLNVVVDAASSAEARSTDQDNTIDCNVYILQPGGKGKGLTGVGLANAVALYAELAASQLDQHNSDHRPFRGRYIMVGWGSDFVLQSKEHLKEAAATMIRLTNDAVTQFPARFMDSQSNHHALRELDPISRLPRHLSLATIVTINTGTLVEQVIERDLTRLIKTVILGSTGIPGAAPGKLLTHLAYLLAGETMTDRYQQVLTFLSEQANVALRTARLREHAQTRGISASEKLGRMQQYYQESQRRIAESRQRFMDLALGLAEQIRQDLERAKREMVSQNKLSIAEVRAEFGLLQSTLQGILDEIGKDTEITKVDEQAVENLSNQAHQARLPSSRQRALDALADRMSRNLKGQRDTTARDAAITVLNSLLTYCTRIGLNLDVVLKKLRRQQELQSKQNTDSAGYTVATGHHLHLMALTKPDEINDYAERISVFSARNRGASERGGSAQDQLEDFRLWLIRQGAFDALFKGDWEDLVNTMRAYTLQRVKQNVTEYKLLDLLLDKGENVLYEKLREAAEKARSMIAVERDYAPNLHESEEWYLCADHRNALAENEDGSNYPIDLARREKVLKAMGAALPGECQLLRSRDPGEIAVCYYADGLPMTAVSYLRGPCLKEFLDKRKNWLDLRETLDMDNPVNSINAFSQRVGVPIYSGQDAEERIIETGVLRRLYEVRKPEVGDYNENDFPELRKPPTLTKLHPEQPSPSAPKANRHTLNGVSEGQNGLNTTRKLPAESASEDGGQAHPSQDAGTE